MPIFTLAAAALLFGTPSSHYRAEPAASPSSERLILRGTIWRCDAQVCVAGPTNSRPEIVCAALVRRLGALRSFSAGERKLSAEELEKCNARAR